MGLGASCLTEGTLCLALPCKERAAGALLQMSPRLGQSLCAGAGYEHSVCVCGGGGGACVPTCTWSASVRAAIGAFQLF